MHTICTGGTHGTHFSLSTRFDACKAPDAFVETIADQIVMLQLVFRFVLVQIGGKGLWRDWMIGIVLTPALVDRIKILRGDFTICLEPEIARGCHKLHHIIAIPYGRFHVVQSSLADGKAVTVGNQP